MDDALREVVVDRVTMNEDPSDGQKPVMHKDDFVSDLKQHCTHEQAATKETAAAILAEVKIKCYSMRGLRPSSSDVCRGTVDKHWQNVGDADLTVCGKVQERTFTRVQAARSFMHMIRHFFTVFYTHVFPAPLGKGKIPPTENWAAELVTVCL